METLGSLLPLILLILIVWAIARRFSRKAAALPSGPDGLVPYGVGSWLALFIFASTFLAPLFVLGQTMSSITDAETKYPGLLGLAGWASYKGVAWATVAAIVLTQWWVAHGLYTRYVPSSARNAKLFLLLGPFVMVGVDWLAAWMFLNVNSGAESALALLKGVFTSGVWLLYFIFSKRVRNTYYGSAMTSPTTPPAPTVVSTQAAPQKPVTDRGAVFHALPPTSGQLTQNATVSLPTLASAAQNGRPVEERLTALKRLLERGLITQDDFERKKAEMLRAV